MSNVSAWSITAGLNNSSPPDGWPEGMARSAVNDAAREMMAALARWYQDGTADLVSTSVGAAYSVTTNTVYDDLEEINLLAFRADRASLGSDTLNVDGLGAKSILKDTGTALAAGDVPLQGIVVVAYNQAGDVFQLIGPAPKSFDVGTRIGFQQTTPPTGWTKEVSATYNDKALRLTTGTASTGGSTAFTSVFAARTVALANLPVSSLSFSLSVSTAITVTNPNTLTQGSSTTIQEGGLTSHLNMREGLSSQTVSAALNSGAVSGSIALGGSGTAMDFAVAYVDFVIGIKA